MSTDVKKEITLFSGKDLSDLAKIESTLDTFMSEADYDLISSADFINFYSKLVEIKDKATKVKEKIDSKVKSVLQEEYQETGNQAVDTEFGRIIFVPESVKVSLDSTKLKEEYPDVYTSCCKVSQIAPSIRDTKKKKE